MAYQRGRLQNSIDNNSTTVVPELRRIAQNDDGVETMKNGCPTTLSEKQEQEFVDLHVCRTYTTCNPDIESDAAGVGKQPVSVSFQQVNYNKTNSNSTNYSDFQFLLSKIVQNMPHISSVITCHTRMHMLVQRYLYCGYVV